MYKRQGVCFPTRRLLTGAGVLAGISVGLAVLYLTLVVWPHPLGLHGGVWSLAANFAVTLGVSGLSTAPPAATVRRIHGAVEDAVYGPAAARD